MDDSLGFWWFILVACLASQTGRLEVWLPGSQLQDVFRGWKKAQSYQ